MPDALSQSQQAIIVKFVVALQAQRHLQKSLEAHGKYITSLIEKDRAGQSKPPGKDTAFQQQASEAYLQPFTGAEGYEAMSLDHSTAGEYRL